MFDSGRQQRSRLGLRGVAAICAVVAVLAGVQSALLLVLVARPVERAVVAAREPRPAAILVRVPEYVEEIEVVGPPRWLRDLSRAEAAHRGDVVWLAGGRVETPPWCARAVETDP